MVGRPYCGLLLTANYQSIHHRSGIGSRMDDDRIDVDLFEIAAQLNSQLRQPHYQWPQKRNWIKSRRMLTHQASETRHLLDQGRCIGFADGRNSDRELTD